MSLDLLVMPLHKFLQGKFETVVERFARETDTAYHLVGAKPSVAETDAQLFVQNFQQELKRGLGPLIRWRDEGDVLLSKQLNVEAWHALRAFAADQSRAVPGFSFGNESRNHPALASIYNGAPTAFVHIIRHNDCNGLYLPSDFEKPFKYALFENESVVPLIGSSLKLLKELNILGQRLGLTKDEGDQGWTDQLKQDDPLALVKSAWVVLRHAARLSVSSRLPIIFYG